MKDFWEYWNAFNNWSIYSRKKEGYNLAAESYEKIYISTKDEYEKIILQLNKSIAFYDTQIDLIDQIIEN